MDKKEALEILEIALKLYELMAKNDPDGQSFVDAFKMSIEALRREVHKQPEQFINKPCVSEKACHEDKMQVLEKIRAEIEEYKSRQLPLGIGIADLEEGKQVALEYVLAILDTYMVESEK